MDFTEALTLIQTILTFIGIIVSIAIFVLGIKISNATKFREEYAKFQDVFNDKQSDLSNFSFHNLKLFIKKIKALKKLTLDAMSTKLINYISEQNLLIFLDIAKIIGGISWNGSRDQNSEIEIIDKNKIIRLAKKLNEYINTR